MTLNEQIKELLDLAEKATPRPWVYMTDETFFGEIRCAADDPGYGFAEIADTPELDDRSDDFEYIVAAVNLAPELCARIQSLEAELARLEGEE